jgi:hypothetical protein
MITSVFYRNRFLVKTFWFTDKYVTAYKGFVFFTESLDKLDFGSNIEVIYAQSLGTDI